MYRFLLLLCVVITISILLPSVMEAQNSRATYRVGRIIVVRREVFDPRKDGWFGSVANSLHTLTREDIIRDELLLREGDVYDPDLVDESERNLRAMGIVGDVDIIADTVRNRRVNLHVYTRDRWTLGVSTTFKQEGGITKMALGLEDNNLLGNAQRLSVEYNYQSDRHHPHGTDITFVEPRLFGSRFSTKLGYRDSEDAHLRTLTFERPFYAEQATWAAGLYLDRGSVREKRYEGGQRVIEDNFAQQHQNGWIAASIGPRTKYRFGVGYVRVRRDGTSGLTTVEDRLDLLSFSASVSRRTFYKGRFLENFGRVEDVPLGYNFSILGGPNYRPAGSSAPSAYMRVDAQYVFGFNKITYYSFSTDLSTFFSNGRPRESTLESTFLHHWRVLPRATFVVRLSHLKGLYWPSTRQVFLGSPDGLRGYPTYELAGHERLLLNLEYRVFPDITLWIFRFGGLLFMDTGAVREDGLPLLHQRFHSSLGIGLRVENAVQQGAGLIRIDFPFNLDRRRFTEVVISADQLIRAFTEIMYYSPNAVR